VSTVELLILVGALLYVAVGIGALLIVIGAARLHGPDTDDRDPYDRDPYDRDPYDELAVARAAGVDATPDGSHDDLPDVDDARRAAEMVALYGLWPEAAMYDTDPAVPPIIPGREAP
jgi:hypothetical protein